MRRRGRAGAHRTPLHPSAMDQSRSVLTFSFLLPWQHGKVSLHVPSSPGKPITVSLRRLLHPPCPHLVPCLELNKCYKSPQKGRLGPWMLHPWVLHLPLPSQSLLFRTRLWKAGTHGWLWAELSYLHGVGRSWSPSPAVGLHPWGDPWGHHMGLWHLALSLHGRTSGNAHTAMELLAHIMAGGTGVLSLLGHHRAMGMPPCEASSPQEISSLYGHGHPMGMSPCEASSP